MRPARALVLAPAAFAALAGLAALAACLPGAGPPLLAPEDAGPPTGPSLASDASTPRADVDLGDPFGIDGLVPSHGPWTGGTRARLDGRGFPSTLRVWIGGTELDPSAILASDPARAVIQTPPGAPGPADVKIRNDATAQERVLSAGFFYDAFVVVPDSGATSGGTRVELQGDGTAWTSGLTVAIAGSACADVAVIDATHIRCTTPAGTVGVKDVTVTAADGSVLQARDAFTYGDSPDGYRGGLAGGVLSGTLHVLAYDAWTGAPIGAAHAIAGGDLATAVTGLTNAGGIATLTDAKLTGAVTVTVGAKCHQPLTFVNVPVDTVTAYLTPVLDPSCGSGDPPSVGGRGGVAGGEIDGELIWPGGIELERAAWTNIPEPANANERRAAYLFNANGSPLDAFSLPPKESAVTPDAPGVHGYAYAVITAPGNRTIYALAGIEDRSVDPPRFTAYAMGVARGVPVEPAVRTTGADMMMSTLLDHAVRVLPQPPAPGPRGPDRLLTQMGVSLGATGYAVFPAGARTDLLPLGGATLPFIGVPALDGALTGETYVIGASAATGAGLAPPASVVARVTTTNANDPVTIGGFLQPPVLTEPGSAPWGGTHVAFGATGAYDLAVLSVSSGNGMVVWTIVAPSGATAFDVPDLRAVPGDPLGLAPGPITSFLYLARMTAFDYGSVRTGQLSPGPWSAYAYDQHNGAY